MADLPDELVDRCVRPYYSQLMGRNAIRRVVDCSEIVRVAESTTDDEVVLLLSAPWRERATGAWLAAGRTSDRVVSALLEALTTSWGSYTSLPLAAVAVLSAGRDALPALHAYLDADVMNKWGAAGFVGAAIEHVGGSVEEVAVTADDRADFASMLAVAGRLASRNVGS